ncbi:MAG: DNA repair protein RecO [Deltaproteobacteria bacterium]|nr:DNA repair protein RecO [Deltaproteobacteria bacterium]
MHEARHYKDRAIVLNSVDYGESDRILTFYTLGRGKMSGIAKGARRSRKRFVGNLDPLPISISSFSITGRATLPGLRTRPS